MADQIPEDMQELIDQAVAEGRVTKVPYGQRTLGTVNFMYSAVRRELVPVGGKLAEQARKYASERSNRRGEA